MKYITHFATEAAYQSALPSLDLPNVSLVDELQEVHYHRALYGGHAGDLVLFDVAEQQKILVTAADWNLTTYPTATYPIIGIVAFDETAAGLTLVATHPFNADGTKNLSGFDSLKWQNTNFDWGLPKFATGDEANTDFNGKSNTATILAAIKAYDIAHSTDNITGNIGQGIQLYSTEGTSPGDWYVPAGGELYALFQNGNTVEATINKLRAADSSLARELGDRYMFSKTISSTEYSSSNLYLFDISYYSLKSNSKTSISGSSFTNRAFLRLN